MSKAKDLAGLVSAGGILADGTVNLASEVTGTLPIASGGTGTTSTTFANLTTNVTGTLPIANGGTNATTADGALTALGGTTVGTNVFKAVDAAAARSAISAAKSGANSDITSITGLTTALSIAQGGTGLTAVGAAGRVLTSNGTNLVYTEPAGGAQAFVTMFNGGNTAPAQNSDGFGII